MDAWSVPYDASGNVTNDGVNQYLYDGEGRICAVASTPIPGMTGMTGYLYDADGTRVAKGRISAWSCDPAVNGFQTTNDYVLGPGGEQAAEMGIGGANSANPANASNSALTWQHTNVYAAGSLIATYDNDGLHFYFNDPLGTRRAQTDYAGVLEQTCSSLPFGDGLSCSGGNLTAPTEHHFTGKERDTESGNDYFGARYYASSMGRFMSPDWSAKVMPVPYAKRGNPQSLNLYSYGWNNPLSHRDLNGHCPTPGTPGSNSLLCGDGPPPPGLMGSRPICWCSGPQQSGFQGFGAGQTGGAGAGGSWDPAPTQSTAATSSAPSRVNRPGYGGSVTVTAGASAAIGTTSYELSSFIPEVAPEAAEAASTALVPLTGATIPYGTVFSMAGYDLGGSSGLVGSTYNYNIWGLSATEESEGISALVGEMRITAAAAGADSFSILGTQIINRQLMRVAVVAAARFGLSVEAVEDSSILLVGLVP